MEGEPEAYRDDSLRSIGISPRERLARIEALLLDITSKLDNKANREDLLALEARVWKIEVQGSTHAAEALTEARRLAEERKQALEVIDADVEMLRKDHNELKTRIAYIGGALAVAAVISEYFLTHFFS